MNRVTTIGLDISKSIFQVHGVDAAGQSVLRALSRERNLAAHNLEVPVRAQAAVAARQVWNASSRRTRSVRREVRWRWTLKVLRTAA
jgi:hypothetical protein